VVAPKSLARKPRLFAEPGSAAAADDCTRNWIGDWRQGAARRTLNVAATI